MATLALSKDFLSDFAGLEGRLRAKVHEIAAVFSRSTPQELRENRGIHLEQHRKQADPRARTIRLSDNHRGIVMAAREDYYVLTRVLPHDAADRWMSSNQFRVNDATGALELFDVEAIDQAVADMPAVPAEGVASLFAHRSDKDFRQVGVSPDLAVSLRVFTDLEHLAGLIEVLPESQSEAILSLADSDLTVEQIWSQLAGRDQREPDIDPDDAVAAIERPASSAMFHVLESDAELAQILDQDFERWRIYLHPSQRSAVEGHWRGAMRLSGGPGTGKSVVAMHRAAFLARKYPDERILLTTFTRNLARRLEVDLLRLAGPDVAGRIDVLHIDAVANRVVREVEGRPPPPALDRLQKDLWREVVAASESPLAKPEFLATEWERVVLAKDITDRDAYLRARRQGRGVRLSRGQRVEVWAMIETFTRLIAERGRRTFPQIVADAAGYAAAGRARGYAHAVIDEGQDLHEGHWRLLRALVPPGADDLFILADSHQRIYDNRVTLSALGIPIQGRARRLRLNYRTTAQILRLSLALVGDIEYDDLDTSVDDVHGYQSHRPGDPPILGGYSDREAQGQALVAWIRQKLAEDGCRPHEIAVLASRGDSLDWVAGTLGDADLLCGKLTADHAEPPAGRVALANMNRAKGMEFRFVAIVDASEGHLPRVWLVASADDDPVQHRFDLQRERCLFYVACTRPRDALWIGWTGTPSRFLDGLVAT